MTLKERYNRARKNYLRRINRAVTAGYRPDVIPIPQNIGEGSIRRLEKWRGDYIRAHSPMVDVETGDELKPTKNKKVRKQREQAYKTYMNMPLQQVEEVNAGQPTQPIEMSTDILDYRDSYEQIIHNWYDNVRRNFYWYIAQFIESKTDELLLGNDAETRRRFAYVLTQNPDIFPEPPYATRQEVNDCFMQVANLMELAPDSEAYQDFMSMYDYVEEEDMY